ncbi:MAG: Rnf-Nqr domain containing protein [Eubacteriales bacterium]|jgi:Na+-transporting NADH:ubiquinone oxidoreductase subunit E|nr:Rnf-Nqr domain containing protein [Eubacteriales bacterium]MDD3109470.1 Rnf-Nqr domain containing protein [Eubacteriales bacterium]MDD3572726.1 Rnf-Nqr domain containing protein [Eubacteriales bacterium]MDD4134379.1 Rnf-Nqr domain containing protein [Eubacteriales bacterium]NLO14132.1 NADH:ubiquinone reductase (Na(+)-transporting) subunit E [Clostridiales bacterium]
MTPSISPWIIFLASIITSNMILANFLGMCSYLSVSTEYKTANGLGMAVTMVLVITSAINWLVYTYVIIPLDLVYLQYIIFIMVIAALVQILEMGMDRFLPDLHAKLGIFLPLITVNCAILGATLFQVIRHYGFIQAVLFGLGSGLGWWLAIDMLAAMREKLAKAKLPPGMSGPAIAFIITGVVAMAFIGFSGIFVIQ